MDEIISAKLSQARMRVQACTQLASMQLTSARRGGAAGCGVEQLVALAVMRAHYDAVVKSGA